jgi:hypothetical protein
MISKKHLIIFYKYIISIKLKIEKWFWSILRYPRRIVRHSLDRQIIQYRFHRHPNMTRKKSDAWSTGVTVEDGALIDRIIEAYRRSASIADADEKSLWGAFFHEFHLDIHSALISGPRWRVEEILRNPASSDIFYGFDSLSRVLICNPRVVELEAPALAIDGILRFAEAVGVCRQDNPERYIFRPSLQTNVDEVMRKLDSALGVVLPINNPYPQEFGATTQKGILSYRTPQAMYQAWRLREITSEQKSPRILEVGAGLGRTALYANVLGLTDYTIVDLPITAVAQAYFLGRTLGADKVTLAGEPRKFGAVAIQTPQTFHNDSSKFSVVLNSDSITEFDISVARNYWVAFQQRADCLLSINHESNSFTVRDLINESGPHTFVSRSPSWMRRGYVEEFVKFARS